LQNGPNSEGVASNIQELWAMTQEVKASKPRTAVGRFDVSEASFLVFNYICAFLSTITLFINPLSLKFLFFFQM